MPQADQLQQVHDQKMAALLARRQAWAAMPDGPEKTAEGAAINTEATILQNMRIRVDELRNAAPHEVSPWNQFYGDRAFGKSDIQMPGFDTTNQDQARIEQAKVIQALQAQAAGNMDTLGQQQLTQGFQRAGQQQQSLGSSIRGTGGGAGLRAGAMGAADVQRGLAGEQQMLKLQEQQAAQAMLAQLMAQQHAQDVGLAGSMAQGALAGQGLNQAAERFYTSGLFGNLAGDYQRGMDYESAAVGQNLAAKDAEARFRNQMVGAGAGAAGAAEKAFGSSFKPSETYRQVDGQNSIVPEWDK